MVKVGTETLDMIARNRNEQDQNCSSFGVKETIEHFLVECTRYEEKRDSDR